MSDSIRTGRFAVAMICVVALALFAELAFGIINHPPIAPRQAEAAETGPLPFDDSAKALCLACHKGKQASVATKPNFIQGRMKLSQKEWAAQLPLELKCGICHAAPPPDILTRQNWVDVIQHMKMVFDWKGVPSYANKEWLDLAHYYYRFAPEKLESLPPDPVTSPIAFEKHDIGIIDIATVNAVITNVNVVDLNQDGHNDVIVCDDSRGTVSWIHQVDSGGRRGIVMREDVLAEIPYPAHTQVFDFNNDGKLDIVVASLGQILRNEDLNGSVVLLLNQSATKESLTFSKTTIAKGLCRTADARPGDFDGDGDIDFVVASFGYMKNGGIGWVEQKPGGEFAYHQISPKTGGIHVPPVDLNNDGKLDFVAVIGQEFDQVSGFINKGDGTFEEVTLYKAPSPMWGSSGIELVDLDHDGDSDIIYTNGDNLDIPSPLFGPFPYYGVQWLENKGNLQFEYHRIIGYYGAYRAVPADMDGDGDLDIVVTSLCNYWNDMSRQSVIWLENDGHQNFTGHGIDNAPTHLGTCSVGDLDGDGRIDIVAGGMHVSPPFNRLGRVTSWRNLGEKK
jgi:hypothetical protein